MYRVVLADDEGQFRGWIRSLLETSEEFLVVGEAGSGSEVLRLIDRLKPDLVISDVDMSDRDGLDLVRNVLSRLPEVKVILVSAHSGRGYARLAHEEGATAFIPKTDLSLEAVRQALQEEE